MFRCTELEGPDGAYNIYENEIRLDLIVYQLDQVIDSLEQIKKNQFTIYNELKTVYSNLNSLGRALDSGEWFDLSKKPIERVSFTFGGAEKKAEGYFITEACIGCQSCVEVCPQQCIAADNIPLVIKQANCLHCGNCLTVCPAGAVERR